MTTPIRHLWESDLTPQQIADEENEILESLARGANGSERAQLLERLKQVTYAHSFVAHVEPTQAQQTSTSTTKGKGCAVCLSAPCSCEKYTR